MSLITTRSFYLLITEAKEKTKPKMLEIVWRQLQSTMAQRQAPWRAPENFPIEYIDVVAEIFNMGVIVLGAEPYIDRNGDKAYKIDDQRILARVDAPAPLRGALHRSTTPVTAHLLLKEGHYWAISSDRIKKASCKHCGEYKGRSHKCRNTRKCKKCGEEYLNHHSDSACKGRRDFQRANGTSLPDADNEAMEDDEEDSNRCKPRDIFIENKEEFAQRVCVFDFETMPINGVHTVYAAGWTFLDEAEPQVYTTYGKDALSDFVKRLYEHQLLRIKVPIVLVGFNSSGFDNYFLMQEFLKHKWNLNYAISNGSMLKLDVRVGGTVRFKSFDCYRFTMASLKESAKSFGLEVAKGDFPHEFMTGWNKLDYEGPPPPPELYKERPDPLPLPTDTWNLKDNLLKYLVLDVEVTKCLFIKLRDFFFDQFKVDVTIFITLSSLAYDVWLNTILPAPEGKEHKPPAEIQQMTKLGEEQFMEYPSPEFWQRVRASVYGGRCFVTKRECKSRFTEDILEKRMGFNDLVEDYGLLADVVSLYPQAMKEGYFPVGPLHVLYEEDQEPEEEIPEVEQERHAYLHGTPDADKIPLGIYEVQFTPTNKELLIPPVASKSHGRLAWDCRPVKGWYTSVDIQNAARCGYQFKILQGAYWTDQSQIFKNYVEYVFKIKQEGEAEGNEVKRIIGKLLLNALYGKQLQIPIMERTAIAGCINEVSEFERECDLEEVIWLPDFSKVILKGGVRDKSSTIKKPSQMGAFVLSYSRTVMERKINDLDEHRLTNRELSRPNTLCYTDTDSLHLWAYSRERGERIQGTFSKELGALSNDFKDGGKIFWAIYLGSKTWACKYINPANEIKTVMKGKGMPKDGRIWEQYMHALEWRRVDELNPEPLPPHPYKKMIKVGDKDTYPGRQVEPFQVLAGESKKVLMRVDYDFQRVRQFFGDDMNDSNPYE